VEPLAAHVEVGNFSCVDHDGNYFAARNSGSDIPKGLVEILGIAHPYLPQLEEH